MNIGDLDKIISYMCLKLQLGVNFNVCIFPTGLTEMRSYRYVSQTTSQNMYTHGEELHSRAWHRFLPIPLVVASSLTVFLSYKLYNRSLVEAGALLTSSVT